MCPSGLKSNSWRTMTELFLAPRAADDDDPQRPRLRLVPPTDTSSGTIRVAIAVRQPLVRAGLRVLLERDERITVVGEATRADQALALAGRMGRGVVLIDSSLPGLDCAEATRQVLAEPETAVLLLITSEVDDRVRAALRAGASGVVLDDADPSELILAVAAVARRGAVLRRAGGPRSVSKAPSRREHCRPKVTEIRLASAHGDVPPARPVLSFPRRGAPDRSRELPKSA
jgi:DNA-binding NarL/FixJ family response regulator